MTTISPSQQLETTIDPEFSALDGVGLAAEIRAGRITPLEAVEAAIRVIKQKNAEVNAVVMERFERARAEAQELRKPDDHDRAPLWGVPFLVKDMNVFTADLPTTYSSAFFADVAPRSDSEIVRRWRRGGLISLGKTNTPEFAADFVTEPAFRGPCRNPLDLSLSPGGSSGGAAAAVASGMVPIAHGTDSGGSIRVPASCCGLVGFKPSRGLTPVGPHYAELAGGLNCEHVVTKTVRDTAAMLDITAGPELGSAYVIPLPGEPYSQAIDRHPPRLRIGYTAKAPSGVEATPEIRRIFDSAVDLLRSLGHDLVPVDFPDGTDPYDVAAKLWMPAIALEIAEREAAIGRAVKPEELEPLTRHSREVGDQMSALDYLRVRQQAHDITVGTARFFADFDILLTPTLGTRPPLIGLFDSRSPDFDHDAWQKFAYRFAPFTELFNVTGQPAISLPFPSESFDRPISGMHLAAKAGHDAILLQLAAEVEKQIRLTASFE